MLYEVRLGDLDSLRKYDLLKDVFDPWDGMEAQSAQKMTGFGVVGTRKAARVDKLVVVQVSSSMKSLEMTGYGVLVQRSITG